ncbi:MAG: hypothetical protein GJ676_03700 [Rhodobacteraceae bacterium]|nr:hypothetical protein [Paracoccaceae bacterium]
MQLGEGADKIIQIENGQILGVVSGGSGNDLFKGDDARDRFFGQGGDDRLFGGAGNDLLQGGSGSDVIRGGAGDDRIVGGAGADDLAGGAGADLFVFRVNSGADTLHGFEKGVDRILLHGTSGGFDGLEIKAQADDLLVIHDGGSILFSGQADIGLSADDFLFASV